MDPGYKMATLGAEHCQIFFIFLKYLNRNITKFLLNIIDSLIEEYKSAQLCYCLVVLYCI